MIKAPAQHLQTFSKEEEKKLVSVIGQIVQLDVSLSLRMYI